jgi:hypothetical protein
MSCLSFFTAASVVDSGRTGVRGAIDQIPIVDKIKNIDIFADAQQDGQAASREEAS